MDVYREDEAVSRAIRWCAIDGTARTIVNSNLDPVWTIEPDTKVDTDDLTFPVIVHIRGGTIDSEGLAIILAGEVAP